jgi:hypothetical protein
VAARLLGLLGLGARQHAQLGDERRGGGPVAHLDLAHRAQPRATHGLAHEVPRDDMAHKDWVP